MRSAPLCALALVVSALSSWGSAAVPQRPAVVELFTSQGCSSCPPADALLGELIAQPNVIALAFHVDYWNEIGWRDPFSNTEATERQRGYVEALSLSSAFTPQMVIDGRRSIVGSDRARLAAAIADISDKFPIRAAVEAGELVVSLPDEPEHRHYDVFLAAYLPQATTRVGRGENSGRTLTEYNIVRQFKRLGAWDGTTRTIRVPLDSFPNDATRAAILVQTNQGRIAAATVATVR